MIGCQDAHVGVLHDLVYSEHLGSYWIRLLHFDILWWSSWLEFGEWCICLNSLSEDFYRCLLLVRFEMTMKIMIDLELGPVVTALWSS